MLLVLDRDSGEQVYMERTHSHRHRASPVFADGHLYLTARDGKVTVVKAGRESRLSLKTTLVKRHPPRL